MNSQIIVPVAIIVLLGIVLALIFLNRRDEKEFEEKLKEDYHKPKKQDIEIEDRRSI